MKVFYEFSMRDPWFLCFFFKKISLHALMQHQISTMVTTSSNSCEYNLPEALLMKVRLEGLNVSGALVRLTWSDERKCYSQAQLLFFWSRTHEYQTSYKNGWKVLWNHPMKSMYSLSSCHWHEKFQLSSVNGTITLKVGAGPVKFKFKKRNDIYSVSKQEAALQLKDLKRLSLKVVNDYAPSKFIGTASKSGTRYGLLFFDSKNKLFVYIVGSTDPRTIQAMCTCRTMSVKPAGKWCQRKRTSPGRLGTTQNCINNGLFYYFSPYMNIYKKNYSFSRVVFLFFIWLKLPTLCIQQ